MQFMTLVFGSAPEKVSANGNVNEFGVDISASVSLKYRNGGLGSFMIDTRFGGYPESEARVFFANGPEFKLVKVCGAFFTPQRLELTKVDGEIIVEEYPTCPNADKCDGLEFNFGNSQALAYEAEGFADAYESWLQSKKNIEHPLRTHKETLIDAKVIDEVMSQVKGQNMN